MGLALAKRKIVISTSGFLHGIKQLISENKPYQLAFSVGHANPSKRIQIMPIEQRNPIVDVARLLREYQKQHNRQLTLEYTLLSEFNDDNQAIIELANLAKYLQAKINLINLNPHSKIAFQPVTEKHLQRVKNMLIKLGVRTTVRYSKGQDIVAACGQLGESLMDESSKRRK